MPSVDVAMARSLRGGIWGSITAGLVKNLESRQITETVSEVGEAFSSWDNCMARSFCKWPVIAVIIVGGLIIFSIVWCLARCLCCGLSCCCSCFKCFQCCGNCCGCCDAPGERKHKYLDDPYSNPNQGYKSQAPMFAPPSHVNETHNIVPSSSAVASPPQYAEFDVSRKRDSNALPAMPTWDSGNNKKVELEEVVELEPLKKPQASQSVASLHTGPATSLMHDRPNTQASPVSPGHARMPYGQFQDAGPGYGSSPGMPQDSFSRNGQPHDAYSDVGYGQQAPSAYGQDHGYGQGHGYGQDRGYGHEQGYGAAGAAMAMSQGRRTPAQDHNNGYASPRRANFPGAQQDMNGYDQNEYGQNAHGQQQPQSAYEQDPYGMPAANRRSPPRNSPGYPVRNGASPAPSGYRRSPGPQSDFGYDRQDAYAESAYDRPQYPPERQASPGPRNGGGFDFQSGGSRPGQQQQQQQYDTYDGPLPRPAYQDRPPPSSGSEIIYPGFKAYQPAQQGWNGV